MFELISNQLFKRITYRGALNELRHLVDCRRKDEKYHSYILKCTAVSVSVGRKSGTRWSTDKHVAPNPSSQNDTVDWHMEALRGEQTQSSLIHSHVVSQNKDAFPQHNTLIMELMR